MISRDALQALLDALAENHEIIGPTVRDGAIVYDRITRLADLPAGWTDHQAPGRYRLERRHDDALFGFTVGPQAWKRFLHRPVETLWTMSKTENGVTIESGESATPKFAFIGVRACELHAIAIQDRVFSQGPYPDVAYTMRRRDAFIVAVNCGTGGRNLLLRFDADGAEGRDRDSTSRSPNSLTPIAISSWSRSAAKQARRFSGEFRSARQRTMKLRKRPL